MKERVERWRGWVENGYNQGARNAHATTKTPTEWQPTTVQEEGGVVTSDPLKILKDQRREYRALWEAHDEQEREWDWEEREALDRATAEEIRSASKAFKRRTAQTYDGFHVRQFRMMSDDGLEALADIFTAIELLGNMPSQLTLTTMPSLPKLAGGYRLIGIMSSVYRLWAKTRKPYADEWERKHERKYFAAGSQRGAVDTVWRQALRAERGVGKGGHAAIVLTDLRKYCEYIDHKRLLRCSENTGFPMPIARVAISTYGGERRIRMGRFVGDKLFPRRSIVPGCGFAATFAKVYTLEAYDKYDRDNPEVALDNFLDDNAVSAEGTEKKAVKEAVVRGAKALKKTVEKELGCELAKGKTHVVASSASLAKQISKEIGKSMGGKDLNAATNLGIDCGAGKRRRPLGRGCKRTKRLTAGRKRGSGLRKLRATLQSRSVRIASTGIVPGMAYGAAVFGMSDTELKEIRSITAQGLTPKARGRSLLMVLRLHDNPCWRAGVEPISQYVRMVWEASAGGATRGGLSLPEIRRAWEEGEEEGGDLVTASGKPNWGNVRGPIGALHLSLRRINWRIEEGFRIRDDLDTVRTIAEHSPKQWQTLLHEATLRNLEREIGRRWAKKDPSFDGRRVAVEHISQWLTTSRGRGGGAKNRGAAKACVCGAVWTNSRLNSVDCRVPKLCKLCGEAEDTEHPRVWWCPASEQERNKWASAALVREAREAGPTKRFYVTGIFPHPADEWQPPDERSSMVWEEMEGHEGVMEGDLYVDGSCTTGPFKELRRAAFAEVAVREDGAVTAAATSPIWRSLPQTPQVAEYVALAAAVQLVTGESTVYSDCQNVVEDAKKVKSAARDGKKSHAGILRDIFKYEDKWKRIKEVMKVKSHQNISTIQEEGERRRAVGNDKADAYAKAAVERHPAQCRQKQLVLDATVKKAITIVKMVGEILPKWPAERNRLQGRGGRRQEPQQQEPERTETPHQWEWIENAWRCKRCLQCSFARAMKEKLKYQRCEGDKDEGRKWQLKAKQHTVAHCTGLGLPLTFCLKCGAWTTRRLYKLAETCAAKRSRAGEQALAYIKKGLRPWLARGLKAEHRKSMGQGSWAPAEDGRVRRAKRRKEETAANEEGKGVEKEEKGTTSGAAARSTKPRTEEARKDSGEENAETPTGRYCYGGSASSGQGTAMPTSTAEKEREVEGGTAGVEDPRDKKDGPTEEVRSTPLAKRQRVRGKQPSEAYTRSTTCTPAQSRIAAQEKTRLQGKQPPCEDARDRLRALAQVTESPPRPAKRQRIRGKQPPKVGEKSKGRVAAHAVEVDCKRRKREGGAEA